MSQTCGRVRVDYGNGGVGIVTSYLGDTVVESREARTVHVPLVGPEFIVETVFEAVLLDTEREDKLSGVVNEVTESTRTFQGGRILFQAHDGQGRPFDSVRNCLLLEPNHRWIGGQVAAGVRLLSLHPTTQTTLLQHKHIVEAFQLRKVDRLVRRFIPF